MAVFKFTSEAFGKPVADRRAAFQNSRRERLSAATEWYIVGLSLLAVFSVAGFFYWVAIHVVYPYELDYGEGIVLWQAQHVTNLATAYAPLTRYPYVVFHYPPLYHVVSLAVSKLTGDLLLAGRLVSSFACIGICLTLAWLVYCAAPPRASRLAAIGPAVFTVAVAAGLDVMRWTPLMRVDMLGLWFTFAGLAVFVLARTTTQRYAAFVLFVAAMYTRQTLIAGAVTCLLIAAILNVRQAVSMLVFTAALGGAVLIVLSSATHGEVIKHLFLYNRNHFSIRQAVAFLNINLRTMVPLLALAGAAAVSPISDVATAFSYRNPSMLRARLSASTYRLVLFAFTVHFMLSGLVSLTAGKAGANVNYLLEWNLSICMLAGLFIARLLWSRQASRLSFAVRVAFLLPILILAQQSSSEARSLAHIASASHLNPSSPETEQSVAYNLLDADADPGLLGRQARSSEALLHILRNSPEPVMSEDMTLLYKAGKQVPFEPAIVTELAATGVWSEMPLINLIRNRTFSVMVIRDLRYRYSPAVAGAIRENYQPDGQYGIFTVYVPSR